jgi:hypothetical protein
MTASSVQVDPEQLPYFTGILANSRRGNEEQ